MMMMDISNFIIHRYTHLCESELIGNVSNARFVGGEMYPVVKIGDGVHSYWVGVW